MNIFVARKHKVSLMELKAIIFDLDGVITDTAHLHFKAWSYIANQYSYVLTHEDNESIKGLSRRKSLDIVLELAGVKLEEEKISSLLIEKNELYQEYLEELTEEDTLPGFSEFFQHCKDNQILLAVGSASKNAKLILDKLGRLNDFDAIVDGTMVTHSKPDPEVFLTATKRLNVTPQQCVVFEDAIAGIKAANAGGFYSVGMGDASVLTEAKTVLKSLEDFTIDQLISLRESVTQ